MGELTFTYQGVTSVYREGESFVETPGQLAQARNASGAPTRVMASYLLPQGAPLSEPQAASGTTPASLPKTGSPSDDTHWLLGLIGAGIASGGWWLRRRHAKRSSRMI
ncbi:MAG TPA: LPXTG cell wall anchor domain-containing protein [Roseiflexaceae bacterium]|nr:LPXTG cell wall anchor domain-containing protein [Roseiflexaceae bacterium]